MSKLASVWNKLNLPLKYWSMAAKIEFCVCHGTQKWSKYNLDTLQTTLSDIVTIKGHYLWESIFSMAGNASF